MNNGQFIGKILFVACITVVFACSGFDNVKRSLQGNDSQPPREIKHGVLSVQTLISDAQLAAIVYDSDEKIRAFSAQNGYENLAIGMFEKFKVKYFTAHVNDVRYIVIRGTSNFTNVKSDILALPIYDSLSQIWLHKGFRDAALGVLKNIENAFPRIEPEKKVIIVGHSLGGAIANILGIYLYLKNYNLDRIVTFGQPKITNQKGLDNYSDLPLFRVVGAGDIITGVPPKTSAFKFIHGGLKIKVDDTQISYTHFGDFTNAIDDDPVSIHMDLDRVSRAVYHKISHYIQRLKQHQDILIQFNTRSN